MCAVQPMFQEGTPLNAQLEDVQGVLDEVTEMFRQRQSELDDMHVELHSLWEELGSPPATDVEVCVQGCNRVFCVLFLGHSTHCCWCVLCDTGDIRTSCAAQTMFVKVGDDLTDERVQQYQDQLVAASLEKVRSHTCDKLATDFGFTVCVAPQDNRQKAIATAATDVANLFDALGQEPQSGFESALVEDCSSLGVSADVIERISALASSLTQQKVRRFERCDASQDMR